MAMTKYTYSISQDFPNAKVDSSRLSSEITASAIVTAFDHIDTSGDDCDIWFKDALSGGDQAVLGAVVAAHSGEPLPDNVPILVKLDSPSESDKKPVFVMSPAHEGSFTWLTSFGDDLNPIPPSSGRGEGPQALLVFANNQDEPKEIEIQFNEPVELHDGHVSWDPVANWDFEDHWSLSVRLPATAPVPNPQTHGNCNLVDTGFGFNLIVPAAGDGTHDVDLNTAVPVPDGWNPETSQGQGFWNVDQYWTETITPQLDTKGAYNLYDMSFEMFFVKKMDCGDPRGIWDLDAYKAEWMSKKWKLAFQAKKNTSGAGKIGGYFMIFRPGAT